MLGFFYGLDPLYLLLLGPTMILAIWAQGKVKSAYARASRMPAASGLTGAQAAAQILESAGAYDVSVEATRGFLSDHYDPTKKVLRLSPDVYQGRSLASLGIAAHEAGHAIQHRHHYAPLAIRNGLVPMASIGSNMALFIFMAGLVMSYMGLVFGRGLMIAAIVLFAAVVLFQLVNLPVEFNASRRAKQELLRLGMVGQREVGAVSQVLNAAALTYVAATVGAIMTLLYFLLRSGLLGGRSN